MSHVQDIAYDLVLSLLCTSLIILIIVLLLSFCRKKPVNETQQSQISKPCARSYTLTDIDIATEGFNNRRVLGKGRLGTVYAGLSENGELIAVKRIHSQLVLSNAGFDNFASTIKSLSFAQHPNIVPILGFSEAPGERIIVMEFVGATSLDFYLHKNPDGEFDSSFEWNHRLRIAAGSARGLKFLHEDMAPNVIHGCVKSSNILIDVKFNARICDYGLTFLGTKQKSGIVGYVDDEYWEGKGNGVCKESDVYGFGVVLLEILSGRGCEDGWLVKWALPLIKEMRFEELFDPRIVVPNDIKPLVRLAKIALACVGNSRKCRPTMNDVSDIINNLEIEVCV